MLILLATMGVTAVISHNSSPDARPQQVASRGTPTRKPAPGVSTQTSADYQATADSFIDDAPADAGFDAGLAAQGRDLHARLLAEANVHEFYRAGSLFGAVTPQPKSAIAVPLSAWESLGDGDQDALMHYAASLVERMRANPLTYCQISASAPAAGLVRENARAMGPRSWIIHGGRLHREGESGPFDILTDEEVASGVDNPLAPKRDLAAPNEVIHQLRSAGLSVDSPWRRSQYDGVWNAVLRATIGENEVSCLLESRSQGSIETVELEAELHRPGQREADVFRTFTNAAEALCKEQGLLDAIEARGAEWSNGKWRLKREPYAVGYGLVLRYQ